MDPPFRIDTVAVAPTLQLYLFCSGSGSVVGAESGQPRNDADPAMR
jgi:hypothetical protein